MPHVTDPLRVAITFPGCHTRGGVERIVLECARHLATRGHEVRVVAADFADTPDQSFARTVVRLPTDLPWRRGQQFFRHATRALERESFDVLNTHGCVCPVGGVHWVQSLQAAWLERCAVMRPPWSFARIRQRLNPLHKVLLQLEAHHFRERRYSKVIATTPQVRSDLVRIYGVPLDDIVIVPNGFNPLEFNPSYREANRERSRSELGICDSDRVVLFVANEIERKGLPALLRAVKRLDDRRIKVVAAGRPNPRSIMRVAEQAGVPNQVLAVGNRRRVADLHAASDLMALPTQYEAFCLAILESLGSGLPVLTSAVPGARDAIIDGVNGVIVDDPRDDKAIAEQLVRMLEPAFLPAATAAAPATVEQFQWPTVLGEYERLLYQAARAATGGARS